MHITNPILHVCAFASTVSAFYPYIPDYRCIQDGNCADASKRSLSNELVDAIQEKGSFEVKIKQRKSLENGESHTERISRYIDHLTRRFEKRESSYSIIPSAASTLPNSAPIGQDGRDFSYMVTMKFGSPAQEMNMLLDTGATTTWVMGGDCTDAACSHHNLFKEAESTTLKKLNTGLNLVYGTGNVSLTMATDTVEVAGYKLPIQFGVGHKVTDTFMSYPMDGILGLAHSPTANPPSFIGALMDGGLLKNPIFGVSLHRGADETNDGSIVFGAVDNSKFSGDITYGALHASHNGHWMITSGEAGFDGKKAGLSGKKVIIDSGTSYCFLPPDDAKKFYSTFPDAIIAENGESYSVPCDTTTPAQLEFDGVIYEISAKDWVGGPAKESGRCTSNFFSRDATGSTPETKLNAWLMGDTFLKNVYAVFDVGQQRVGFAKKAAGTSTSSSATSSATGTTIQSSHYKIPSRYSTTLGKNAPLMTRIEDMSTTSVAEPSSSSSSSMETSINSTPDETTDIPSTESSASIDMPSTLETSTRTELDLIITAGTSSATSSGSAPTGTDFTGMQAGQSDANTTSDAAGAAPTAPANNAASSLSASFTVFATALLASLAILI